MSVIVPKVQRIFISVQGWVSCEKKYRFRRRVWYSVLDFQKGWYLVPSIPIVFGNMFRTSINHFLIPTCIESIPTDIFLSSIWYHQYVSKNTRYQPVNHVTDAVPRSPCIDSINHEYNDVFHSFLYWMCTNIYKYYMLRFIIIKILLSLL